MSENPPEPPGKISHWDRPKPPHDWRWVVGGIGRALITLGLLMFAFVAYQLWGTGIQTAQAQRTLSAEFDDLISTSTSSPPTTTTAPTTTTTVATTDSTTAVTDTTAPATTTTAITTTTIAARVAQPIPAPGEAIARLEIPRMGLNRIVVEGATADDLTKGPGHFPETPLPGQLGNAAIAGHRTTHLHPFLDIDQLQPGDDIIVTTLNGRYVYRVTGTEVVSPDDYALVIPTTDPTRATLTLVSCTPRYSAKNRIVVRADLSADESDPLTTPPAADPAPTDTVATTAATATSPPVLPSEAADTVADSTAATTTTEQVAASTAPDTTAAQVVPTPPPSSPDAFVDGWFSDTGAIPQAVLWGALLAAIAYGILWLSRRYRRYLIGVAAGFVPFIVVLYFFYENVNRLLPPNL